MEPNSLQIQSEQEKLIQENANLALVSKLINSSVNKTVHDTIISIFGEMKEGDAILVAKNIPLICQRIQTIMKNQEEDIRRQESREKEIAAALEKHREELKIEMQKMNLKIDGNFITKDSLALILVSITDKQKMIEKVVYGACAIILISVLTAIVYLVVQK